MLKTNIIKLFSFLSEKRKNQKKIHVIIFSQIYLLFLSFFITFFIFRVLADGRSTLSILFGENIREMLPRFLVSYLIILIICEFLYLATFFLYAPLFIVYPVVTVACVANIAKINFRNEPFVFADLLLFNESMNIASQYPLRLEKYLPVLIPGFILLLILPVFIRRVKINILKRVISGLSALVITVLFFTHALVADSSIINKTARSAVWNLADEYRHNGFILEFMLSAKRSLVFAPPDYNKDSVREYALSLGYPEEYIMGETPEVLPNVIIIMNESYWDSDNLTGIAFNKDPLESVRALMKKNGSPALLVPHLGGVTANIEFEFLTGKNIIYYPPASMVYQLFVTRKHWSLAWYFRDFGYSTTAIHPYYDWFWKRSTVYPLLGFENMYFEHSMINKDMKGIYRADKTVSQEIIDRYEMFSEGGSKPVFTFAVTMQNHGPYYARYFGSDAQIRLLNQIDEHPARAAETFAEGLRYASEAFIYLTEYFKDAERPTYIIMFGDHAPAAIVDTIDFYAIGESDGRSEQELYNRYVTPAIIWTNQNNYDTDEIIRNIGTVTPQMLTDEIFNITGMPKPAYIKMLENIKKSARGFTNQYIIDDNGVARRSSGFERIADIYEKLRIVQYDATLGKNYFIDEFAD